jgi:hypothetical protein
MLHFPIFIVATYPAMMFSSTRSNALFLLAALCVVSCKKEEESSPTRTPSGGNNGPPVVLWSPELTVAVAGMENTYGASNATFSDGHTSFADNGAHYVLQEAVVNAGSQGGQWRIGFIGTFVQPSDEPVTVQQRASLASLYQHFYGRYIYTGSTQTYQVADGVRIVHTDPDGVVRTSGYGPQTSGWSFNVQSSSPTNATSGAVHQIRVTFNCVLYGTAGAGNRTVSGSFQGPFVFN